MIDRARLRGLAESVVDGKGRPFSSDAAPFLEACTPSVVLELLNVISVLEQALWPGDASNLLARAEAAEAKLAEVTAKLARALKVIRACEWIERSHDPNEDDMCPSCGWEKGNEHHRTCELAAVLGENET